MITTISPVNICHAMWSQKFFLMMRTFKIYFLSNFPICNVVVLITDTVLCITSP